MLPRGAGTKFSSGAPPTGLDGSIGGRFLSGGGFAVEGLGVGTKAGAKLDGEGSGALATPGLMPLGLTRDLERKFSLSLLEAATESWLSMLFAKRCLSSCPGRGGASCGRPFLFESKLGARLAGEELPLGMGPREGVRE